MLLIVGGRSDPNTLRIAQQSSDLKIEHLFWDTDLPEAGNLAWDFETPDLDIGSARIRPDAIFARWNVFGGEPGQNLALYEMVQSYAFAWDHIRLLNRESISDANNKSANLALAKKLGFAIPSTIVMSNLSPLATMPDQENQIAKPLMGGAHTLTIEQLLSAHAVQPQKPQFIQERLDGENLRLFVIHGQLFCFQLKTDQLDYRTDHSVDVVAIDCPQQLKQPALKLANQKRFDFCAIDFRCREGFESPVFLEVNSFPMFVRFDDAGSGSLSRAILEFLTS